jgi:tetratricopeptide (TPR) repeat protein
MKLLLTFFLAIFMASAQHQHAGSQSSGSVQLMSGLGNHSHPIATNSEMAQKFFDQGLALVFGFNHDEAARSFTRASELDPHSPMPHWGVALSLGSNYNMPPIPEREEQAWIAIQKALELSAAAPENERLYVQALAKRYSKNPADDRKRLAVEYARAMKELTLQYPDDLDAATLYAESLMDLRPWQLWDANGNPAEGTLEIVGVLENVLRRDPNHPGANHYYIHAVEASNNPERGLPSAMRLGSLMPGAGHMVHMPSHIFLRLGDFEAAANVNKTASEVDREYIEHSGIKGVYPLMYYSHNLHFVSYVRMMQGNFDEAFTYSQRLKTNVQGAIDQMPMLAQYGAFQWHVLTRFAKWEQMLEQPAPVEKSNYLQAMYRYSRGSALAGLGRISDAQAERERMQAIAARIPESEMLMANMQREVLSIGMADLDARISRARKDSQSEIAHLRRAAELQDRLNYMEPPEWYYPIRESLGGALLRAGQYAEAEAVFRKDLADHPRNGRSLFGLVEALRKQQKTVNADWVQREFNEAWRYSSMRLEVPDL